MLKIYSSCSQDMAIMRARENYDTLKKYPRNVKDIQKIHQRYTKHTPNIEHGYLNYTLKTCPRYMPKMRPITTKISPKYA